MKFKIFLLSVLMSLLIPGLWAQQNGEHKYLSAKTLVLIYEFTKVHSSDVEYTAQFSETEIDQVRDAMAKAREFYWRNSKMKLNLEVDYLVCQDPITRDELRVAIGSDLGLDPVNVFNDVTACQMNPADYGTIIGVWKRTGLGTDELSAGAVPWSQNVTNGIASLIN